MRLDEGDGIEVALRANNARYHKSCKLLFNNTKLQIAANGHLQRHRSMTAAAIRRAGRAYNPYRPTWNVTSSTVDFVTDYHDQRFGNPAGLPAFSS